MRNCSTTLASITLLILANLAFGDEPISFTTTTGRSIIDAKVSRITSTAVTFTFPSGAARIPIEEIPVEARKQLGIEVHELNLAEPTSLEDLQPLLNDALLKDMANLEAFKSNYVSYLESLREEVRMKGQLEEVLAVEKEIENYVTHEARTYPNFPKLNRLRSIFEDKYPVILEATLEKQNQTRRVYHQKLEQLKIRYTKENQLEDAKAVATEQARIVSLIDQSQPDDLPVDSTASPLWELKSPDSWRTQGEVIVTEVSNGLHLKKGGGINSRIGSQTEFKPPFKIVARLTPMTASCVRFLCGGEFLVQFNMGTERDILYLHRPPGSAKSHLPGKGELQANVAHDIEILVRKNSMEVFSGGELRGTLNEDFQALNAPVFISPFRECPLIVEKFEVWPLQ